MQILILYKGYDILKMDIFFVQNRKKNSLLEISKILHFNIFIFFWEHNGLKTKNRVFLGFFKFKNIIYNYINMDNLIKIFGINFIYGGLIIGFCLTLIDLIKK